MVPGQGSVLPSSNVPVAPEPPVQVVLQQDPVPLVAEVRAQRVAPGPVVEAADQGVAQPVRLAVVGVRASRVSRSGRSAKSLKCERPRN